MNHSETPPPHRASDTGQENYSRVPVVRLSLENVLKLVLAVIVTTSSAILFIQSQGKSDAKPSEKCDTRLKEIQQSIELADDKLVELKRLIDRMYDVDMNMGSQCQRVIDDDVDRRRREHR